MSYKIASFNMCKFHENINNKELIKIASAINNEKIDILAIQEIFSKGALDNLLAALGSEWEGCWDSPNSRSPSAAEGYAFAWRKNNIGLTKNREGKVFKPTILNQYKMHKELYLKLLEKSTKLDPANAINFQKKLIRNPYYGRFSPADLPGLSADLCAGAGQPGALPKGVSGGEQKGIPDSARAFSGLCPSHGSA